MDDRALFTAFQQTAGLVPDREMTDTFLHYPGDLVITSGRFVACDPWFCANASPFEAPLIEPGRYRVALEVARFSNEDQRIALAAVIFRHQLPVRWENARTADDTDKILAFQDAETARRLADAFVGYGVDSGTGCFLDAQTADAFDGCCLRTNQRCMIP